MRTYTIYTQCEHCGVYDRDPKWCALCGRPKATRQGTKLTVARTNSGQTDAPARES